MTNGTIDLTGKIFGKLTVVNNVKINGKTTKKWLCRCECGNEKIIEVYSLLNGDTKTCGCSKRNYIDFIGKTFGRLTIKALAGKNKHGSTRLLCSCSCGKETIANARELITGNTKSCGCLFKDIVSLPNGQAAKNHIICEYKTDAKRRKLDFQLSVEEMLALLSGNCYYCGQNPQNTTRNKYSTGSFTYNGIDRVNNSIGYVKGNVVSCCKICNYAKNTQTQSQFISWVKNTFNHLKSNNLL